MRRETNRIYKWNKQKRNKTALILNEMTTVLLLKTNGELLLKRRVTVSSTPWSNSLQGVEQNAPGGGGNRKAAVCESETRYLRVWNTSLASLKHVTCEIVIRQWLHHAPTALRIKKSSGAPRGTPGAHFFPYHAPVNLLTVSKKTLKGARGAPFFLFFYI